VGEGYFVTGEMSLLRKTGPTKGGAWIYSSQQGNVPL